MKSTDGFSILPLARLLICDTYFLVGLSVHAHSDWAFISMVNFDFDAEGEVADFVVAFVAHDGDDVDSYFSLLYF